MAAHDILDAPDVEKEVPEGIIDDGVCNEYHENGKRCRRRCMRGEFYCKTHSNVPRRQQKTYMYSKHLPTHLRNAYKRIAESGDLLTHQHDIALMQVRCNELAGRLASGESNDRWHSLREQFERFRNANRMMGSPDEATRQQAAVEQREALQAVDQIISSGVADEANWDDLQNAISFKSELQAKEWKRLREMQAVATAEQVRTLVFAITTSVLRNVPDANQRRAIVTDIMTLRVFDVSIASPFPEGMTNDGRQGKPPADNQRDSQPIGDARPAGQPDDGAATQ
jgi:hypothetical protein